jgi:hypothetical protein
MARSIPFARLKIVLFLTAVSLLLPASLWAQEPITITPNWVAAQTPMPAYFSGLSLETQIVLPNADGIHYFRPDNQPLIALYKTLGIKDLRIGGNTADNPAVKIPDDADIDSLFAFAHAAGVKVSYTVRLKGETDATNDIAIVKYIQDHYAADLDCFAIGNEPTIYLKQYPVYRDLWGKMMDQIIAAVPDAQFCGPNTDRHYDWAVQFAKDFGPSGHVKGIYEHAYVGLSARKVTDVVAARDKMLSDAWVKLYQGVYDGFAPQAMAAKIPYRMEETNTFFNGGKEGASDTFTAALWGLDYMHWWARHGAAGINFHTGDKVAAGADSTTCRYAAYTSTSSGYELRPVGYAIKAFDLGGHGSMVDLAIQSPANLNVSAYGVVGSDGDLYVTVINKEHGTAGRDAAVTLDPGKLYTAGDVQFLADGHHDITDKTSVMLGGAIMGDDGSFSGKWTSLQAPSTVGQFTLMVPAASAAIVRLSENDKLTQK